MIAVLSGNSAGLFNSSINADGTHNQSSLGQANENVFANISTGSLLVQNQDSQAKSLGLDFGFLRTYNSLGAIDDGHGEDNWRLGFLSSLTREGGINSHGSILTRVTADGAKQTFNYDSTAQNYISTEGNNAHDTIELDSSGSAVFFEGTSRVSQHYNSQGQLTASLDHEGKGVHYSYSQGLLNTIQTDTSIGQEQTTLGYNAQGLLETVTLGTGANAFTAYYYHYDTQQRLQRVTVDLDMINGLDEANDISQNKAYEISYEYYGDSQQLKSLSQSDGTKLNFEYYDNEKLKSVTDGIGNKTSYTYNEQYTDVETGGRTFRYHFDLQGRLTKKSYFIDKAEISKEFKYDSDGNVKQAIDEFGRITEFGYDELGNQLWVQDSQGKRVEKRYNEHNQLVKETQYLNVDPDGLEGIESASGAVVQYNVFDHQKRLRFQLDAKGNVVEYSYNGLGQNTQIKSYRNAQLANANYIINDTLPSLNDLFNWRDELTQQAKTDVEISEFSYDFRGNVERQTRFEQVVYEAGKAIGKNTASQTYTYDIAGRVLSTTDEVNQTQTNVYDGLGRVILHTNAKQQSTSYLYDSKNNTQTITNHNGLITTSYFDNAGRLTYFEQGIESNSNAFGEERFYYNEQGKQAAHQHKNGTISFTFYDSAGRKHLFVSSTGLATEFKYNLIGQLANTFTYANKLDTQGWLNSEGKVIKALADIELVGNAHTRVESMYYNASGELTFSRDAAGYVTEFRYDGLGRKTDVINYKEADDVQFNALGKATIKPHAHVRVARYFYDAANNLVAELDGEGYLTEHQYDGIGNKVASLQYASRKVLPESEQQTGAQWLGLSLSDIRPAPSEHDRNSYRFYNGNGQKIVDLASDGAVTHFSYYETGKLKEQTKYFTQIKDYKVGDVFVLPAVHAEDQKVAFKYNELGQITEKTQHPTGLITQYQYDKGNNLIATIKGGRGTLYQYDLQGMQTGRLDAEQAKELVEANTITEEAIAQKLINIGQKQVFNSSGELVSREDSFGNITYMYYDKGRLVATVSPSGAVTHIEYNAFGEQSAVTTYHEKLPIHSLTLQGGSWQDVSDAVLSLSGDNDSRVESLYTNRGLLSTQKNSSGAYSYKEYNAYGQLKSSVVTLDDAKQKRDFYYYDKRGLLKETNLDRIRLNATTTNEYDAFGRVIKSTDANSNVVETNYNDDLGQVINVSESGILNSITYDVFGRKVAVKDGTDAVTEYIYDSQNNIEYVLGAEGSARRIVYNEFGQLSDVQIGSYTINEDGTPKFDSVVSHTHIEYDSNGQVLTKTLGYGSDEEAKTVYKYNEDKQLISEEKLIRINEQLKLNGETELVPIYGGNEYRYNSDGQLLSVKNGRSGTRLYGYNGHGQKAFELDENNYLTKFTFNDLGKVTSKSSYQFDLSDVIEAEITRQNQQLGRTAVITKQTLELAPSFFEKFDMGEAISEFFAYDEGGRLRVQIDGEGGVVQRDYDALGRVLQQQRYASSKELGSAEIKALKLGQLGELTIGDFIPEPETAQDQRSANVYDSNGNTRFILTYNGNQQAQLVENHYDQLGQITHIIRYATLIEYQSDYQEEALVALLTENNSLNNPNNNHEWLYYDAAGRVRFSVDASGAITEQRYDKVGHVKEQINYHTPITQIAALGVNSMTRRLEDEAMFAHFDSVVLAAEDRHTQNFYNTAGKLEKTIDALGNEQQWTYNSQGQKSTYTDAKGKLWRYFYTGDKLSREVSPLVSDAFVANLSGTYKMFNNKYLVTDFSYDGAGNVYKKETGYVTSFTSKSMYSPRATYFSYDKAGRQTGVTEGENESKTVYNAIGLAVVNYDGEGYSYRIYDSAGRVAFEVDQENYVTQYKYDGLGNKAALLRFAEKAQVPNVGEEFTMVQMQNQLSRLGESRTIEYSYDAQGRVISQKQDEIEFAQLDSQGHLVLERGRPETRFTYNQLGQVTKKESKINSNKWAIEYNFYDSHGKQIKHIDAEGYVTRWEYNQFGEIEHRIEYANKLEGLTLSSQIDTRLPVASPTQDRVWEFRYDELGRKTHEIQLSVLVSRVTDNWTLHRQAGEDLAVVTEYDEVGNVKSINDKGRITNMTYDVLGRMLSTQSHDDAVVVNNANLKAIASSEQKRLSDVWTEQIKVTKYTYDVYGNVALISQDFDGDVTTSHTQDRVTQQFYNEENNMYKTVDALGNETLYRYNKQNKVQYKELKYVDEFSSQWTYQLSQIVPTPYYGTKEVAAPVWLKLDRTKGRLTGTASYSINKVINIRVFDVAGQQAREISVTVKANKGEAVNIQLNDWQYAPQGINLKAITRYNYDKTGKQIELQHVRYNHVNNQTVEAQLNYQYNAFGELIARGDNEFNGQSLDTLQEQFSYNLSGQLSQSNGDDGVTKSYKYDLKGNLIWQDNEVKGQSVTYFDKLGRAIKQVGASFSSSAAESNPTILTEYDRWGNVASATDALGNTTTYIYDYADRVIESRSALTKIVDEHGVESYERPTKKAYYDSFGKVVAMQDANGNVVYNRYSNTGKLKESKDELGSVTQYAYSVFDDLLATEDELGYIKTQQVDELGRVVEKGDIRKDSSGSYQHAKLSQFEYNSLGQKVMQRNALGEEYYYFYDSQGKLLASKSPESIVKSFEYDRRGNKTLESYTSLASAHSPEKDNNRWGYDYFGRVQTLNDLDGNEHTHEYYDNGLLKTKTLERTNQGDQSLSYEYYENGLLKKLSDKDNNAYTIYTYNGAGQVASEERYVFNNAIGTINHKTTYTYYDTNGRVDTVVVKDNTDDENIASVIQYSYDANGNRRSIDAFNGHQGKITQHESEYVPDLFKKLSFKQLQSLINDSGLDAKFHSGQLPPRRLQPGEYAVFGLPGFQDRNGDKLTYEVTGLPEGLTYHSEAGYHYISGKLSDNYPLGDREVQVKASDGKEAHTLSMTLNIAPSPDMPYLSVRDDIEIQAQTNIEVGLPGFISPKGLALNYRLEGLPEGLTYQKVKGSHRLVGTVSEALIGQHNVTIKAIDIAGNSWSDTLNLVINAKPIDTPTLQAVDELKVTMGHDVSVGLPGFYDKQGRKLTIEVTGYPPTLELVLNSNTAYLSGSLSAADIGDHEVTMVAKDDLGNVLAEEQVILTVIEKLVNATEPRLVTKPFVRVSQPTSNHLGYFKIGLPVFIDETGEHISYQVEGLPSGYEYENQGNFHRLVSLPGNVEVGDFTITLKATNQSGLETIEQVRVQVQQLAPVNLYKPPMPYTSLPILELEMGKYNKFHLPKVFSEGGESLLTLLKNLPIGITYNRTTHTLEGIPRELGNFTAIMSASYTPPNFYDPEPDPVLMRVRDTVSNMSELAMPSNVKMVEPTTHFELQIFVKPAVIASEPVQNIEMEAITAYQGVNFEYFLPKLTDVNGQRLNVNIIGLPQGLYYMPGTHSISGRAISTGDLTLTLKVQEDENVENEAPTEIAIKLNVLPKSTLNEAPKVVVTPDMTLEVSKTLSAHSLPYFIDKEGGDISYRVWGLPSGVSYNATNHTLNGTPRLAGKSVVSIRATDLSTGQSTTHTFNIEVKPRGYQNLAPNESNLMPIVLRRGWYSNFHLPKIMDYEGAALTYSILSGSNENRLPPGLSYNRSTHSLMGRSYYMGTYHPVLRVTDSNGKVTDIRLTVEISNTAPLTTNIKPEVELHEVWRDYYIGRVLQDPQLKQAVNNIGEQLKFSTTGNKESHWFTYDKASNVIIDGGDLSEQGNINIATQGEIIRYDALGRASIIISKKGGTAQEIIYDDQGRVVETNRTYRNHSGATDLSTIIGMDDEQAQALLSKVKWGLQSKNSYDLAGQLKERVNYFSPGSTKTVHVEGSSIPRALEPVAFSALSRGDEGYNKFFSLTNAVKSIERYDYFRDGKQKSVEQYGKTDSYINQQLRSIARSDPDRNSVGTYRLTYQDIKETDRLNKTSYEFDKGGRASLMRYSQFKSMYYQGEDIPDVYTHNFSYTYLGRESYLEHKVNGSGTSHFKPATTTSYYDANGNRYAIEEKNNETSEIKARYFDVAVDGTLLKKVTGTQTKSLQDVSKYQHQSSNEDFEDGPIYFDEGERHRTAGDLGFKADGQQHSPGSAYSHYIYSQNQYLGEMRKDGNIEIKNQHFSTLNATHSSGAVRHLTVKGDTLKSMALKYYGNTDYWYLIADANGLSNSAEAEVTMGQTLDIPTRANAQNRHDTFTPFDVGQLIGDTTPSLPFVPPPPEAGCNGIASVIMIAVAVVATIYTAGAAASAFASAGVGGVAAGGAAVAGVSGTMATGMAVLGGAAIGTSAAAGIAAAAIGGFVGSVASQMVGKAMGVVDSFSLKGALASGLTAGASAGMGSYLQGSEWATAKTVNGVTKLKDLAWQGRAALGATAAASSFGANKLVGNKASFRWGNVAASAFSSGIGADVGQIGQGHMNPINGIFQSGLRYGTDKLLGNEASWNFGNVAVDAFGNAIGNSIVAGMQQPSKADLERQAKLDAMGQKLFQDTSNKVNENINNQMAQSLGAAQEKISQDVTAKVDRMVWAMSRNASIDADAAFAANEAAHNARMNKVVANANYQSELTSWKIKNIDYTHVMNTRDRMLRSSQYAEQLQARYAAGDMQARARFDALRPDGIDVSKAYDWDSIITNATDARLRSLGSRLDIDRSVSAQERLYRDNGELDKLYYSRVQKDDPVGAVGLGVWGTLDQNIEVHGTVGGLYWKGVGALTTLNSHLALWAGSDYEVIPFTEQADVLNREMALDVAEFHLDAVQRDFNNDWQGVPGLLSEAQITQYHHDVFRQNNASVNFYGGTLFIGDSQSFISEPMKDILGLFYLHPAGDH